MPVQLLGAMGWLTAASRRSSQRHEQLSAAAGGTRTVDVILPGVATIPAFPSSSRGLSLTARPRKAVRRRNLDLRQQQPPARLDDRGMANAAARSGTAEELSVLH